MSRTIRVRGCSPTSWPTVSNEQVKSLEFNYIGGPSPYLRIALPLGQANPREEVYLGSVDGRAAIKRLRDYLTKSLAASGGATGESKSGGPT